MIIIRCRWRPNNNNNNNNSNNNNNNNNDNDNNNNNNNKNNNMFLCKCFWAGSGVLCFERKKIVLMMINKPWPWRTLEDINSLPFYNDDSLHKTVWKGEPYKSACGAT